MDVAARVAGRPWYHVIELPGGIITPGSYDVRPIAPAALPDRLDGRRCLDVGTFDGFWAFEMEKRGAKEVIALDVADPSQADMLPRTRERYERGELGELSWGEGFVIAHEALDSEVRRLELNAYDLAPARIGGAPDFVLCGNLLQHLRDPVRVLERIRTTLGPDGELVVVETVLRPQRLRRPRPFAEFRAQSSEFTWWMATDAALMEWLATAGFDDIKVLGHHDLPWVQSGHRIAIVSARPSSHRSTSS